jgi:alginate O-acetyltransferase complex protein AlgI
VTLGMFIVHWSLRDTSIESAVNRMPVWAVTGIWTFMAGAILLTQGNSNAFIYFQF